jgi:hypothetical protein
MTSADFLDFSYVSLHRLLLQNSFSQCISKTSPGKSAIFLPIYLPHLHCLFSSSYWALVCLATLPIGTALYVISVRQTRDLPPTSFRFHLTVDTLVLSYTLTTTRSCQGLSPFKLPPYLAHKIRVARNFNLTPL